jgi:ubiquinone/menaquinone biosynthesis C-methylase UbiE
MARHSVNAGSRAATTARASSIARALSGAIVVLFTTVSGATESEIDHLADILRLVPGSVVADIGAGSGEVSIAIAKHVEPQGTVYATEIDPTLLERIRSAVQKAGVGNVVAIAAAEHDTGLPPDCCDAVFLREVYHHLTDPIGIDRALYRAMRPGARLAIIDYEPSERHGEPAPAGVPANRGGHGVPKRVVAEELTQSGFELVKIVDWPISSTVKHYCMLFTRPSVGSPQ